MKKGINKRMIALVCALVLAFCDVGSVLAENNVTLSAAEDTQDGIELPDQDLTDEPEQPEQPEQPDEPEQPEQPEHTHAYVESITKEPTTTEKGEKTYTCECGDSYTEEIDMLTLKNPVFEKVECIKDGIVLSWEEVKGATYYKIFRGKETDRYEEYEELVTVNVPETSYIDKEVESGEIYCYYAVAYNEVNESMHTSESIIMFLAQPGIACMVDGAGIQISIDKVKGANYYSLERLDSNMLWEEINRVKSSDNLGGFIDSNIVSGEVYTYRIKAIFEDEERTFESVYSEEVTITWEGLGVPQSFKAGNNGYTQLKLTWEPVVGAEGYQIYRSKTNKKGSFVKVATATGESYIDKKLTTDTTYYYKIRAFVGDEVGEFTEVKSATPKVIKPKVKTKISATSNSIQIGWLKSTGAHGYYVYRKRTNGEWKRIATVKDPDTTKYTDKDVSGRYLYAVRAYKKVGDKTYTSYRSTSIETSVLGKVKLSSVKQKGSERAITVTWNKVSNATGYEVYKKIGKNGSWKLAKTTDADTLSYSTEIPQGTYTYWKVRAIRTIGKMTTRAAYSSSKSFIFANPKFNYGVFYDYEEQIYEIELVIENTSKETLRFYSENASMITEKYLDSERNLYIKTKEGKRLTYSEVKPGKTKTITYKVEGDPVVCEQDTIMSFMFRYDGLKYLLLTYADSSYYELYLVE